MGTMGPEQAATSASFSTLGDLIRAGRKRAGLTQEQVAERAGSRLTRETLAKFETGRRLPPHHQLEAIGRAVHATNDTVTQWKTTRDELAHSLPTVGRRTRVSTVEKHFGRDDIYEVAEQMVRGQRVGSTIRATHVMAAKADPTEANDLWEHYLKSLQDFIAEPRGRNTYKRACYARDDDGLQAVETNTRQLLENRKAGRSAAVRYFYENPLIMNVVLCHDQALLTFPDRAGYPFPYLALRIHDADVVDSLKDWFDVVLWETKPFDSIDADSIDSDFATIKTKLGVRGDDRLKASGTIRSPKSRNSEPKRKGKQRTRRVS